MTAIVPATSEGILYIEKTVSERPTLWFYIPYKDSSGLQAEFILKDINETPIYKTTFPLKSTPGLINVSPGKGHELKFGQQYRWVFSVICNSDNRSGDATVNGWLQRVDRVDILNIDPAKVSDKERLNFYTKNLLWFDVLNTLVDLNSTYPEISEYKIPGSHCSKKSV